MTGSDGIRRTTDYDAIAADYDVRYRNYDYGEIKEALSVFLTRPSASSTEAPLRPPATRNFPSPISTPVKSDRAAARSAGEVSQVFVRAS